MVVFFGGGVQRASLAALLRDESDVLIQAQTGSGKTLAFLLPCLAALSESLFQVQMIRAQVGPQMLQVRSSPCSPRLLPFARPAFPQRARVEINLRFNHCCTRFEVRAGSARVVHRARGRAKRFVC